MIQVSSSSARRDHSCDRSNQVQERNHGELAAVNQERTARIRDLVFLFFHFPSVVVRSWKIEVFGMAAAGRGYNEPERRHVIIQTLLDAGVENTREPQENICSLVKAGVERRAPQYLAHLEQLLHEVWAS